MAYGSGLKRQMVYYIIFQATVFVTLAVEMAVFVRGPEVTGRYQAIAQQQAHLLTELLDPISMIMVKVALMLGILLLTVALVMGLFIKRITIPLAKITDASVCIAEGDLSSTVPVHFRDELGSLAQSINDLSANYQEVLLLINDLSKRARATAGEAPPSPAGAEVCQILDELNDTVEEFSSSFFRSHE